MRDQILGEWSEALTREQRNNSNERIIRMNTLSMKGNWNVIKGKMKQKWAKLTDDDLQFVEGKEDELLGRIQKRTGETRENVEKALDEACSSCGSGK